MKMYRRKMLFLALLVNGLLPLQAMDTVQESNSTLRELKKLLFCIKSKEGCSKKQIAAIVVTAAGLIALIAGGSYGLYRLLLKKRVPATEDQGIRATDVTPLMAAVMNGNLEEVERLNGQGHDINQTDKDGYTLSDYDTGKNPDVSIYLLLRGVYPREAKDWSSEEKIKHLGDFIAEQTATKAKWEARKQEIRKMMNNADANQLITYIESTYATGELP